MTTMKIIDSLAGGGTVAYAAPSNSLVRVLAGSGSSACRLGGTQVPLPVGTTEFTVGAGDTLAIYAGPQGALVTAQEGIA